MAGYGSTQPRASSSLGPRSRSAARSPLMPTTRAERPTATSPGSAGGFASASGAPRRSAPAMPAPTAPPSWSRHHGERRRRRPPASAGGWHPRRQPERTARASAPPRAVLRLLRHLRRLRRGGPGKLRLRHVAGQLRASISTTGVAAGTVTTAGTRTSWSMELARFRCTTWAAAGGGDNPCASPCISILRIMGRHSSHNRTAFRVLVNVAGRNSNKD